VTSTRGAGAQAQETPGAALGPPSGDEQRLIGRAVHDTLAKAELHRWAPGTEIDEGARSAALRRIAANATSAQGLDERRAEEVERLVRSALGSPTVRSVAATRHFRELPLAAPIDLAPDHPGSRSGVVEGFADLVGELDDGLVVIDFKTFVDRGAGSHATDPEHLCQVAAYAYALRSATGRPVTRAVVCYLFPDGADEVSLAGAELEAAVEDVVMTARLAGLEAATTPSR